MRVLRLVPLVSGVVALWWMVGPAAAFAEEEADFGRTGFYVGLGGALTHLLDPEGTLEDELSPPAPVDTDVKESYGVNARGGYRFHSHFAVEIEGDWHVPFDADFKWGEVEIATGKVEPLVFTSNIKGYLFKDRFQPYGVLGIGVMAAYIEFDDSRDFGLSDDDWYVGFAARFGGGGDLYVTEHIVLNAEIRYVLPTGAAAGLDMISFGWAVQYRF